MRSDIGLQDLKHLRKGTVERMMRVLRRSGLREVLLWPCFRSGLWGVKYCWERCSSILTFETGSRIRNKNTNHLNQNVGKQRKKN
jgi:hypothetical protein